jgi:hypothetical protein
LLLGLSADQPTPLLGDLKKRVKYKGIARWLEPTSDEDLGSTLRDLGFNELTPEQWTRHPKAELAVALIAEMDSTLSAQGPCGEVADLQILDYTQNAQRYRDRWTPPTAQNGRFIVRRPQAYGADLWGYAELKEGRPTRLLDFPLPGSHWRGCDSAWRLQMAIDAEAGKAQTYAVRVLGDTARLNFFSPIPDWARRRLAIIGEDVAPSASLLAYVMPVRELAAEEDFLRSHLFLQRVSN